MIYRRYAQFWHWYIQHRSEWCEAHPVWFLGRDGEWVMAGLMGSISEMNGFKQTVLNTRTIPLTG